MFRMQRKSFPLEAYVKFFQTKKKALVDLSHIRFTNLKRSRRRSTILIISIL